jgi:hypothetical protein
MAFMYIHGPCANVAVCRQVLLSYNEDHVPSIPVDGVRQPLCRGCHAEWNRIHRTDKGLDPIPLHPDAYEPKEVS